MRFYTFEVGTLLGWQRRLGIEIAGRLLDANAATRWRMHAEGWGRSSTLADAICPPSMLRFIETGPRALDELAQTAARWSAEQLERGVDGEQLVYSFDQVRLRTPLPDPPSLRDFYAFEAHVKTGFDKRGEPMPNEWYEMPVYYKGATHRLLGTGETVNWPPFTERFDYELELALVIGREGRNIPAAHARSYVFGYTVMNDFSARDIQRREMKVRLGPAKGKDWATALGPCLVTVDEIGDPQALAMTARVNGEQWSSGSSRDMYWSFDQIVEFLTAGDFVRPGDILGSGTVGGGCGLELDRWVRRGDLMELEIEHIGVLSNRVV